MFDRLFGEGMEQQFKRLRIMVPVSLVLIIGVMIYGIITKDLSWIAILFAVGFVWGIRYVPKFVFHNSIGGLFADNIFAGVFAMAGMLILSCAFGVLIMAVGILRFIYLLILRALSKNNSG